MKSSKSLIRPLKRGDLASIMAVIDATGLFDPNLLAEMIQSYFSGEPIDAFWLTYDDGSPVAVAYCAHERMTLGTWNLLLIAVHPDRQRQDIGAALMLEVEKCLMEREARVLLVETSGLETFEGTRSFYRRLGYQEEARIRDFYQEGEDKIIFCKTL
jgi:ribosomal protein S18 acetylase RimI-like enzyme